LAAAESRVYAKINKEAVFCRHSRKHLSIKSFEPGTPNCFVPGINKKSWMAVKNDAEIDTSAQPPEDLFDNIAIYGPSILPRFIEPR